MKTSLLIKRICSAISLLLVFSMLLCACNKQNPAGTESSDTESNTVNDPESKTDEATETETETELSTERPDYGKMQLRGKEKVSNKDLGLRFFEYTNSNPWVADIEINKNNVTAYIYNSGTTTISGSDCFGHTASFTLKVDEDYKCTTDIEGCSEKFIEVSQFGSVAMGGDDTAVIQKAIDAAKPGETVYIYPGIYHAKYLFIREGVTVKMYNKMENAADGYTNEIGQSVKKGTSTVIVGARFMNNTQSAHGSEGSSNFTISGGVLDMNCTSFGAIIFGCAENIRLENVIFKDIKGNHTIQLTGCRNVSVVNCMFAGYVVGDTFTREVLQIEPSTPGATGSGDNPPLKFFAGEYNMPENITIDKCYFGKSDEAGAPLMAIGHHSQVGKPNVTGLKITNNVFDECLYAAIRFNNIVDVEITGNKFISTAEYKNATVFSQAVNPAFITFYHYTNASTYTNIVDNRKITKATEYEQAGIHNVRIENNSFTLGKGSDKRIMYYAGISTYKPGATYVENLLRQDKYNEKPYSYSGYILNNNYGSDITFKNNTIDIQGQTAYDDNFIFLSKITGLDFSDNKITLASGVKYTSKTAGISGVLLKETTDIDAERKLTLVSSKTNSKHIRLSGTSGTVLITVNGNGSVVFNVTEGGTCELKTDRAGTVTITPVCKAGYKFAGFKDTSGNIVSAAHSIEGSAVYTAQFVKE